MAATPDNNLRLDLPDVTADDNTWGAILNVLFGEMERSITDNVNIPLTSSDHVLTVTGAAGEEARKAVLNATGVLVSNVDIIAPNEPKIYIVRNATTGSFTVGIKTAAGSALDIPQGETLMVWCDGANNFRTINAQASGTTALATNALQLGGVVAANYAQKAVKNTWTNPQIVQANQRTLTTDAYTPNPDTDSTIIIAQAQIGAVKVTINNPTGTPIDGQILVFIVEQHAVTPQGIEWGIDFIFPDDTNIDLTQTINKVDAFSFMYSLNLDRWMNFGNALNFPRS